MKLISSTVFNKPSFTLSISTHLLQTAFLGPEGVGFVGDTAIVMLSVGITFIIINILLLISSFFKKFPQFALFILPLSCLTHTILMIACIIVAAVYKNTGYAPRNSYKILRKDVGIQLYELDGEDIVGPSPYKITFALGFYSTCFAAGLSMLSIFWSGYLSYKSTMDQIEEEIDLEAK